MRSMQEAPQHLLSGPCFPMRLFLTWGECAGLPHGRAGAAEHIPGPQLVVTLPVVALQREHALTHSQAPYCRPGNQH